MKWSYARGLQTFFGCVAVLFATMFAGVYIAQMPACSGISNEQRDAISGSADKALADAEAQRQRMLGEIQSLRERTATLQTQLADAVAHSASPETVAALQKQLDDAQKQIEQTSKGIATVDKIVNMVREGKTVFEASFGEDGSLNVTPAATAIGAAVGGPAGALIGALVPSIFALIQTMGKRKAQAQAATELNAHISTLKGIDLLSTNDAELNKLLNEAWPTVEVAQTPRAREITNTHSVT